MEKAVLTNFQKMFSKSQKKIAQKRKTIPICWLFWNKIGYSEHSSKQSEGSFENQGNKFPPDSMSYSFRNRNFRKISQDSWNKLFTDNFQLDT